MRAVLVKVGALLAPNYFRVALGDQKIDPTPRPEEEQEEKVGVTTTKVDGRGGREEGEDNGGAEGQSRGDERSTQHSSLAGTAVRSVSSAGDDSEYSGIVGMEEEEGGGVDGEGEKGGERWYEVMKEQVGAHKEDIGADNDADRLAHMHVGSHRLNFPCHMCTCRCRLWADLAKLGRKCEVWDVAFIAAKFCLIYDDKRWTGTNYYSLIFVYSLLSTQHTMSCIIVELAKKEVQPSKTGSKSKLQKMSSVSVNRSRSDTATRTSSSVLVNTPATGPAGREAGRKRGQERLSRDLLRTLAETHCIHAEVICTCTLWLSVLVFSDGVYISLQCAVFWLKESGHELGHGVSPPSKDQSSETAEPNSM